MTYRQLLLILVVLFTLSLVTANTGNSEPGLIIKNHHDWIAGWGTLALATAGIAQGKNRSGLNWFLLTMFFGPVSLFCLVVSDKLREIED